LAGFRDEHVMVEPKFNGSLVEPEEGEQVLLLIRVTQVDS
jgi:hypothetical protein